LLARRHAPAEQYRCRSRLRWSESKNSPQHKHLRCPDCAIVAPRPGRAGRPHRPRARHKAQSEEDRHQPRRRRVKDVDPKKTSDEEQARSNRLKKGRFGSALTAWAILVTQIPTSTGVVGPLIAAIALITGLGRVRRAVWQNHRYRFTTWRWGRIIAALLLAGLVLRSIAA
jgi:hypothetical protein